MGRLYPSRVSAGLRRIPLRLGLRLDPGETADHPRNSDAKHAAFRHRSSLDRGGQEDDELQADTISAARVAPRQPEPTRVLVSTYYDTPAGSLTRSSISLRRRQEGPASSWRLELPTGNGRIELEEAVSTPVVPAEFLTVLAAHLHRTRLVPAATIRTHRTTSVCAVGGSQVRVSHDRVEVLDGDPGVADFAVVRVDLLDGDERARDEIVERLVEAGAEPARRRGARGSRPASPSRPPGSPEHGLPSSSTTS